MRRYNRPAFDPGHSAKAGKSVAGLRNFLAADAVVPLPDRNPLGVAVNLKGGLGAGLDAIDRALAA